MISRVKNMKASKKDKKGMKRKVVKSNESTPNSKRINIDCTKNSYHSPKNEINTPSKISSQITKSILKKTKDAVLKEKNANSLGKKKLKLEFEEAESPCESENEMMVENGHEEEDEAVYESENEMVAAKEEPEEHEEEASPKKSKETSLKKAKDANPKKGIKRKLSSTDGSDGPDAKKPNILTLPKKERKVIRKSKNQTYDLGVKIKGIWEKLRDSKCSEKDKNSLLKELSHSIKGRAEQLIFAHDTARVIECLVSLGTQDHRTELFEELKGSILPLAKSIYSKFFLLKILKYGTKEQKNHIIQTFYGKIVRLMLHKEAASVVEAFYNEYASAEQRAKMIQEFYGPTFSIFKDVNIKNLKDLLEQDPSKKTTILTYMQEILNKMVEKGLMNHSLVHHLLREYLTYGSETENIIEGLKEALPSILHTKDGAHVAMACIWKSPAKTRKKIVRSFKTHVVKIAKEEHGHLVLMALFDSIDDTKMIEKSILSEMATNIKELLDDKNGKKVLLYILHPRDSRFFHPDIQEILKKGDGNENSKKDTKTRQEEILKAASPMILKYAEENYTEMLENNQLTQFLWSSVEALYGSTNLIPLFQALIETHLSEPYTSKEHPLESHQLELLFKHIIGPKNKDKPELKASICELLTKELTNNVWKSWAECNRGSFFLLRLAEANIEAIDTKLEAIFKEQKNHLQKKSYKGAELLLQKLTEKGILAN